MKYNTRKNKCNKKITKKRYRKNYFRGGHEHQNLRHYHISIKLPNGSTREMPIVLFERSHLDENIRSATIKDIQDFVKDRYENIGPFTLFWNGKKLDDPDVKLRQILVRVENKETKQIERRKIPLFNGSFFEPIYVVPNSEIGDPINFEAHDLDLEDFYAPQTPR